MTICPAPTLFNDKRLISVKLDRPATKRPYPDVLWKNKWLVDKSNKAYSTKILYNTASVGKTHNLWNKEQIREIIILLISH